MNVIGTATVLLIEHGCTHATLKRKLHCIHNFSPKIAYDHEFDVFFSFFSLAKSLPCDLQITAAKIWPEMA